MKSVSNRYHPAKSIEYLPAFKGCIVYRLYEDFHSSCPLYRSTGSFSFEEQQPNLARPAERMIAGIKSALGKNVSTGNAISKDESVRLKKYCRGRKIGSMLPLDALTKGA